MLEYALAKVLMPILDPIFTVIDWIKKHRFLILMALIVVIPVSSLGVFVLSREPTKTLHERQQQMDRIEADTKAIRSLLERAGERYNF